jgi:gas vesicle protein
MVGALTGSLATLTIGYIWYRQSGARELLAATKKTKQYVNTTTQKLKENTPEPNEALDWLRNMAQSYAAFIPGARGYVDAAFNDIDAIREKHGEEVDRIVSEAYGELRDIAQRGDLSLLTAQRAWETIVKHLGRIGDLAGDAAQQIMDNHPKLKEQVGGNLDKLKEMGRNYGPQAKEEVDRTWNQIADVLKTGMSAANIEKIRKIVQEKTEKVKKLGDQAWEKGMEEAKPYLDKNPTVKKIVEENADSLKQGNVQDLYYQIKKAVESGDTGNLQDYVKSAADKAKQSGFGGFDQYLNKIPGGDQIIPKLTQIQEVAEKHGDEAQRIMKDAVNEISEILKKRGDEAADLAKKAKEDSKK